MFVNFINKLLLSLLLSSLLSCVGTNKRQSSNDAHLPDLSIDMGEAAFSLLIAKDGKIVSEEYYNGKTQNSLCNVQSLTKGLMNLLIGIAIDEGFIKSEMQTISPYFQHEFESIADERKKSITIKHLLNQTSGLAWKGYPEHESWLNSEDPISFVLQKDLWSPPGEKYNYNSGATHLLSAILTKASGMSTLAFADKYLFSTLGIDTVNWERRNKGFYDGSGLGLEMRPVDLMKIGIVLMDDGMKDSQQVISKEWLDKSFDTTAKAPTQWGLRGSKHGYCWYQATMNEMTVNYGMGYGGQFIILIPEKELVIVTTHEHDTPDGIDQQIEFLNKQLPELISRFGG